MLVVPTDQELAVGENYRCSASGKWCDAIFTCGPKGWGGWPLRLFSRLPSAVIFGNLNLFCQLLSQK
ncbi:hypothetical protein CCP3SC1_30053 [Gammaproteobacteria bacterium]